MGDRVSISFKDKDGDESIAIFNHWGGTEFPKVAFDWFKEFKKSVNLTARENSSDPISRFDSNNMAVQFISWLGKNRHYRQCSGFDKDESGKSVYYKPLYNQDQISHSIYLGKDYNDGDNSDNAHYTIDTHKTKMIDDRDQSIE